MEFPACRPHTRARIGIDFGTTNSSIGLADGDRNVELVQVPHSGGFSRAYRSLLYLEQVKARGRSSINSWTGPAAIETAICSRKTRGG